jgi:hypothetical protein
MLVIGVINGGLGLQLAEEGNMFIIPYCVLAGVLYTTWFAVVIFKGRTGKHAIADKDGNGNGRRVLAHAGGVQHAD